MKAVMRTKRLQRFARTIAILVCVVAFLPCAGRAEEAKPLLRQPVAMALVDDGRRLLVANQHSGTVAAIDTAALRIVHESKVGHKLSDLAAVNSSHLLAVDEEANHLLLLRRRDTGLDVIQRLDVSPAPVSVQIASDGSRCCLASLWSRRLTIVELASDKNDGMHARVTKVIDLPFAPRKQLVVQGDMTLVVADAFGGRLAVVDIGRGEIESVRTLPAHNIRGLALDRAGDHVLMTHQILNGIARTTFDDVHWGNVITNNLRSL